MTKKYLVKPGFVFSNTDGEKHYVSADMLIRLYGVDRRECIVRQMFDFDTDTYGLIVLRPRFDGNYRLPEQDQ